MTIVLGILLCACSGKAKFDGSKTGDSSRFDIDFEMLNTSYSHDLSMKAGEEIEVSLFSAVNGAKHLEGVIVSADEEKLVLKTGEEEVELEWSLIAKAQRTLKF